METYRVCFADTDAAGIVYHGRYFEIAERSRNFALQTVGLPPGELLRRARQSGGAGLVVHKAAAKFISPGFADDLLTLRTDIPRHSAARSWWRTEISRAGTPVCTVELELVCMDVMNGKAMLMPEYLMDAVRAIAHRGAAAPSRDEVVELVSA
jgi:acyl-CoA thioester hydrolase